MPMNPLIFLLVYEFVIVEQRDCELRVLKHLLYLSVNGVGFVMLF